MTVTSFTECSKLRQYCNHSEELSCLITLWKYMCITKNNNAFSHNHVTAFNTF